MMLELFSVTKPFLLSTLISLFLLFSCNHFVPTRSHVDGVATGKPNRDVLEIGIGVGGGGGGGIVIGGDPSPTPGSSPNCPPPPAQPPVSPRVAIATQVILEFKERITCDPFHITDTWVGNNACNFKGFSCTLHPIYKVQALYAVQFNGYNFDGENLGINNFIERLPDVSIFHANSNNFKGIVPDGLDKLPYLFELDLSNNKYTGGFPLTVLKATNLTFLDLRFNSLVGCVPPQVFNLQVVALFINNNNFKQLLPDNLGSTPAAFLTLANNNFFGPIPCSIGQLANTLYEVLFLNNHLTGCLPYQIGLLKHARVFDVEGNQLTGPIPHSFGCLENMQYLIMARNQFYGPVPEFVCNLPLLVNLTLHDNYFTQVGPKCMSLIHNRIMDVRGNCIPGLPNQKSPQECAEFLKQPKYCPDAHMQHYMPCGVTDSYLDNNDFKIEAPVPQPTFTYAALSPQPY